MRRNIALVYYATFAGDDVSGSIPYAVDLSKPFTTYVISETDKEWSHSLVEKLHYSGKVVHSPHNRQSDC